MPRHSFRTAALVVFTASAALAEDPLSPISVGAPSLVATVPGETAIAVSSDGLLVRVGINRPKHGPKERIHYSNDGGASFQPTALPSGDEHFDNGRDPSVAFGGSGAFYYSTMDSHLNIALARFGPTGAAMSAVGSSAGDCKAFFGAGSDCETDQPHLAADPRKAIDDQLYLVWRGKPDRGDASAPWTGLIECSTDGGATWSAPKAVWERDKGDFPRVTVDADGRAWVVMVERSRTGGGIFVQRFSACAAGLEPAFQSFGGSSPRKASDFDGDFCTGDHVISGLDRCNEGNIIASPTIAVDRADTRRVFVTWAERTAGVDAEIVTVADRSGGDDGFPLRTRVDTDSGSAARFLPDSCAVNGQVFVGWYDRRNSRAGLSTNDTTDYYVGAVGIRDLTLVHVPAVRVSPVSDAQCLSWPEPSRQEETAEACTVSHQLAGTLGGVACDFSETPGCQTRKGAPKYGDYNGIACDATGASLTWASHASLGGYRKGRAPQPGATLSVFFAAATPRPDAAAALAHGDAFFYQLSGDGKIEKPLQQAKLQPGVSAAVPFVEGLDTFLLLLNRGGAAGASPSFEVRRLELAGSLGARVDRKALSAGWTAAVTYGVLGSDYVFLYKAGSGLVKVRKLRGGGVVAPSGSSPTQHLEPGWTSVRHYSVGLNHFLLFVNAGTGAMRVRRVNSDGLAGAAIQSNTWTRGYTTIEPFTAGGKQLLFKLKAGNGTMHVERINDDGTTGAIVDNRNLGSGFGIGIPYEVLGGTFVLLLNPDAGALRIHKIEGDGTLGGRTESQELTSGWKTASVYSVGLGKYLALVKP